MSKFKPLIIICIFASVVAIQVVYMISLPAIISEPNDRGLFGDMFGGVTALFSGLAFAGMICAIILQSKELALQRQELELTRKELHASREEQAKSAKAQEQLVEKQLLTARIQGMSAIVQGRYQYASSYGVKSRAYVKPAEAAEKILKEFMQEAGAEEISLPENIK